MIKSQPYQGSFQNTHSKMKTNIRLWMYTLNGTVWYLFCLDWSSISCFRDENVSHKSPVYISGKITTVPGLFSDHSLKNENKHQIMNVHTENSLGAVVISPLSIYLELTFSGLKQLIPDQTEQNGYHTVPIIVYLHNLMFVFIFEWVFWK